MSTPDEPQDEQAGLPSDAVREEGETGTADAGEAVAPVRPEGDDAPALLSGHERDGDATEPARDETAADPAEAAPPADPSNGAVPVSDEPDLEIEAAAQGGPEGAEDEAEAEAPVTVVDRGLIEALLFAADEPLTPAQIKKVLGGVETSEIRAVLEAIRAELDERRAGFALVEVAGGFQFRTRPEYGVWIRQLRSERPSKLSKPALETLAVVSYRQPVTRAEIEAIRRVDTGAVLKTLLDRRLLKVVGTKDVPGRPALYGTSKEFLEVFRLKSLKELPTLKEIRDVAAEMGDALDVPRELLPEEVAAALPPVADTAEAMAEFGAETGEDEGEPGASADDQAAREAPDVTEEPQGSAEDEPAPSPPSAAAEED